MEEKRFRLDFVIAFCALLISTVAAVATVYQTHVIARQFTATVWPYLSFDATFSPYEIDLDLRNDGLGPAIVRSVQITWNGKPQSSLETLFAPIVAPEPRAVSRLRPALHARDNVSLTTSTPTVGMVIPANAQHVVIRMVGAVLVQRFRPDIRRFGLALCYCSLTGSCWTESFQQRDAEPKNVSSCPRRG